MEISNLLRTNMTIVVLRVDDGWFKQPYLAQVRLIGLCGWGRLHIGCALRNAQLCAQVKPATTTHTQGDVSKHGSMLHLPLRITILIHCDKLVSTPPPCSLGLEEPSKSHLGGV